MEECARSHVLLVGWLRTTAHTRAIPRHLLSNPRRNRPSTNWAPSGDRGLRRVGLLNLSFALAPGFSSLVLLCFALYRPAVGLPAFFHQFVKKASAIGSDVSPRIRFSVHISFASSSTCLDHISLLSKLRVGYKSRISNVSIVPSAVTSCNRNQTLLQVWTSQITYVVRRPCLPRRSSST